MSPEEVLVISGISIHKRQTINSFCLYFLCCILWLHFFTKSSDSKPTHYRSLLRAMNSMFAKWNIKADRLQWNISGEPCSGAATDHLVDVTYDCMCTLFDCWNPVIGCLFLAAPLNKDRRELSVSLASLSEAQNQTQPITDPSEARALNTMFAKWNVKANTEQWNISGEPCSGAATDHTVITDSTQNPFIKCDCSYNNSTLCHITQLKVDSLNVAAPIPDELWTLTYLFYLNLNRNYLTGSLSPSIGNLTRLQDVSIAGNALSGEIPKEVGKLTELISLFIGRNNFSGPLPSEMGNLVNLQRLSIYSCRISSEIPQTFAKLKNLTSMVVTDTGLSGRIPYFIGNWSKLTTLVFRGNNLQGPIPSTLSNLTSLIDLRISDLSSGSSSLEFIKNLKNLNVLMLRNNNISGSIPSEIAKFPKLWILDVSYNNLMGSLPSWVKEPNMQLMIVQFTSSLAAFSKTMILNLSFLCNLVGNNFTIDSSNSSSLPSGLECLQRNFPCNRSHRLYHDFAINCGGHQFMSSNGIMYEMDSAALGPATYFVSSNKRWAVSSVGLFTRDNNVPYTRSSSYQFPNTSDSELYQTARISASSLRYYGLGLENGNYTVNLMFSETAFEDSQTWRSLGKRVFDVYIQGKRILKNFDIQEEAGGASFQAVHRNFKALVTENYLEIHLFWAGKGTYFIPAEDTYGPSISAISATPDFIPTVSKNPPSDKKSRTSLIVGIVVPVAVLSFLSLLVVFRIVITRRKKSHAENIEELSGIDVKPFTFSYEELKTATDDFNSVNKLGEGGFGPVYKGKLDDGRVIAAKQLSVTSHQGKNQFVTEIATISSVQHRNLVKLYGCCIEGNKRLLVYEYLENKSLDRALFVFNINHLLLPQAWNLYEKNREDKLVDSALLTFNKEEVKRVIRVALWCTQTSPSLRPSMSRVVAILLGDAEVSTEITRPGYLTDWKFDDMSSLMTDSTNKGTNTSYYNSSASTSIVGDAEKPLVYESALPKFKSSIKSGRTQIYISEIFSRKVYEMNVAGPVPDELLTLTFLFDLDLTRHYLTGSLSPCIGNLTRLQYLSIAGNALPGFIGRNNFSGPLPSEIGNLVNLQELGYGAPEYAMRGYLTKKTDIFAFGVVSLGIVSGRPNSDSSLEEGKIYLLEWVFNVFNINHFLLPQAWNLYEENQEDELADSALSTFNKEGSNAEVSTEITRPRYLTDRKFEDVSRLTSDGATKGTNTSYHNSSASTSMVGDAEQSHVYGSALPILSGSIKEANALNTLFAKWGIKADTEQWNISGEPCTGAAIDSILFTDSGYNPLIKCVCSFANNTRCRIDQLKVYSLGVAGSIPDELWELDYLYNLDLRENYLSGSLPPGIGNLTRLKYLSFGNNGLSGELPKELGELTEMLSLSVSQNNFSGPLPPELGNLKKLQQLYIDSSGVSGEIPSTFANLQELITVYASDNELTGSIPDFIGNWSKLNTLRLQGNAFQGPIPSTFANLASMVELRISELSNGSSSLAFIKDMKNLTVLVLRNNNISESIPTDFNEYPKLSQLDLSFNNVTGKIPDSLFNMSSLNYLFLGNNKLNGTLPAQKSSTLLNVDLSYNFLVGSLPSWVNQENLQLNLIGNNLTLNSSARSSLPSGLECLQRNFPCNRGQPIYYNFSIKCGGPQITASDGIVYERENETVGPASYYVTNTKRWAVSNIGYFTGNNNPRSSIMACILFPRLPLSQGNLALKDFDIRKQAGGLLSQVVVMPLKARVTENYLEVHLFWAGKGTCCVPTQGTYGPAISAISATPDFLPTVSNKPPAIKKKDRTGLIVGVVVGVGVLSFLSVLVVFIIVRRRRMAYDEDEGSKSLDLNWSTRYEICLGVARGLAYLHEESRLRIVHRDVKSSNILLDSNLVPKISDFGLAKLYDDKKTHISTRVAGTIGYLAPEYAMRGHLTEKTDVFAFGVVALEVVSGRPNSDPNLEEEQIYLLEWAWNLYEEKLERQLVDSKLSEFDEEEVKRLIGVALLCTQTSPSLRPSMSRVVAMLQGDIEVSSEISRPGYLTDWKFDDVSSIVSVAVSKGTETTYYNSSVGTSIAADREASSPVSASEPIIIHSIIKEE
ncbi:hypothetical protein FEM48_Zijuj05G0040200 [Ziziphus jujuba var. spinosa]|uniref:non-specific serine/threonine protein kinase n=1 Tax=Ziziphus jujuba var. spinosa TaxID=714518 RepID=A0A978VCQ2_ZIZJJ|nr:hypothetical protein FEM48_Zijuj05G0040200 [Ziziphus jujuba var. spinosa]